MSGAVALRRLASGDAPAGSVVAMRKVIRTTADIAREVEEFIRINCGRLRVVLDKASGVVTVASKAVSVVGNVIRNADEFLNTLRPLLPDMTKIRDAVTQVLDLTTHVDTVIKFIQPVVDAVDSFVQTNIVRHLQSARDFISIITGYIDKFNNVEVQVWAVYNFVADKVNILVQAIGGGKETTTLAPASSLPYCSESVCVRANTRSGVVYRNVIFPARFLQFFFEKTGRRVLPGLFEGWVSHGISHMDAATTLITLEGVADNADAPPMIVVMTTGTGAIRRLIQLYESDGTTPYVPCAVYLMLVLCCSVFLWVYVCAPLPCSFRLATA